MPLLKKNSSSSKGKVLRGGATKMSSRIKIKTVEETKNNKYEESVNSESYDEQADPIVILRKEIQDWRIRKTFDNTDDVSTTSSQQNDYFSHESQNEDVDSSEDIT
ncbi:hypothetical protein KPH14_001570 [Odynerus spinipes]|uniref:Uncharacterized protein n=1 Tax=Odynerus spinipes TaxID=1348599 RepID=A0AAD9RZA1_9HYME|nr:hypothetical protein KPH14_001570 [Odynerus spinipes]